MKEQKVVINRQTLHRLRRSVVTFLRSKQGMKAKLALAALFVLMLVINGLNVVNSFVGRDFMSAIEAKDVAGFHRFAWLYVAVFAASTVVAVFFRFAEERLGLLWRDWMTRHFVGLYIDRGIYLRTHNGGSISNADQRIAEDVKSLAVTTLSFILMIVNGTVTAVSFSGVLWSISPKLFLEAVCYATVGSALTMLLGRPLVRLNYHQADREADFRSELIRVRENAEGIAFTGHQDRVRRTLVFCVDRLVQNYRRIVAVNRNLNFFTTGYNYLIQIIPVLIVAPLFISGKVTFGVIGQSAMAFATLLGAFSLIVTQFQSISAYAAVIARIGEFQEAADRPQDCDETCRVCGSDADHFDIRNLTLRSTEEDRRVLLDNLNATFRPGCRLLVHGPNEAAKRALFRAAAGLYETGTGTIARPPLETVAFLPEQPYMPPTTLRELLLPANRDNGISNKEILAVLEEAGLGPTVTQHDGFETPRNWHEVLSFEEQQLMAVTRVLIAQPHFALLDHLDSALTDAALRRVSALMQQRNITCISLGDEEPDPARFDAALEFRDDGSWEWKNLR